MFRGDDHWLSRKMFKAADLIVDSQKNPDQPDAAPTPRQATSPEKTSAPQHEWQIERTHQGGPNVKDECEETGTEKRQNALPALRDVN